MNNNLILFILSFLMLCSCSRQQKGNYIVLCIPVYGQSLALGEEAERITDFDSLAQYAQGRIVTEQLDHQYGYFDHNEFKKTAKKLFKYQKRAYELSVYNMARIIADNTGRDTLICIFPGGQGATTIENLSKETTPYRKFIENIQTAYKESTNKGWTFIVPAVCWMQGESDIVDYPNTNYHQLLTRIWKDMNHDILDITQQKDSVSFICYQANSLTRAKHFNANNYICQETAVPQTFVDLLSDNHFFWASGPTYPYECVNEKIHINAKGQQSIGALAALSALGIIHHQQRQQGLIPLTAISNDNEVTIRFSIPQQPLAFDTLHIRKADHMGFSVITPDNRNIIQQVTLNANTVIIRCSEPTINCQVRYAVNGEPMKSGRRHGPRGNLRDTAGHWCYQFDMRCK
jgi:hypothetical protein